MLSPAIEQKIKSKNTSHNTVLCFDIQNQRNLFSIYLLGFFCIRLHIIVQMINQTMHSSQLSQQQTEQKVEIVCSSCDLSAFFKSNQEVSRNNQEDFLIIRINQQQAYCKSCLENKIQQQKKETRFLQQRFIYFKQFQSSFQEQQLLKHKVHKKNIDNAQQEQQKIKHLLQSEQTLMKQLGKYKQWSNLLKEKIYNLQVEEQKFWQGINRIERRTTKVEQKSLLTKFDKISNQQDLEYISKMSVLHVFIDIRVDDTLAYVQGMAMGKKGENIQISWEEISIGLGHLLIGINFLMLKYSYELKKIEKIKVKGFSTEVTLKGKSKIISTNFKQNQKTFGQLLQVFLYQTYFICEHILQAQNIQYSQEYKLPFSINAQDGKIVDLFIDPLKLDQRTRWNIWTKSMRYFLIDFKHILTVYAICDKYL